MMQAKRLMAILCTAAMLFGSVITAVPAALADEPVDAAESVDAASAEQEEAARAEAEEAARRAEEEAERKAAEEAAAKKAAEEAEAKKVAEEVAAKKAAEEAERKAAEEAAAKAAEEVASQAELQDKGVEPASEEEEKQEEEKPVVTEEAEPAQIETPEQEEPTEETPAEESVSPADQTPAEEIPSYYNSAEPEGAENAEPAKEEKPVDTIKETTASAGELEVNSKLTDTMLAGVPYIVTINAGQSGVLVLTLYADHGDEILASMNNKLLEFAEDKEARTTKEAYNAEIQVHAGRTYEITFTADRDTEFALKALKKTEARPEKKKESKPAEELKQDETEPTDEVPWDEQTDEPVGETTPEEAIPETEEPENDIINEETDPEGSETEEASDEAEAGEIDPEGEEPTEEAAEPEADDRSVSFEISYDGGKPVYGGIAHFKAELVGLEGLDYIITWQKSTDDLIWEDTDEHEEIMDVEITPESCRLFWRVKVDILEAQED